MTERKRFAAKPDVDPIDAEFVDAVTGLYHLAIDQIQPGKKFSSLSKDDQFEARSVATGLIVIRQLLDQEMRKQKGAVETARKGILLAYELLDALVTGTSGPIRRYVSHLGSVKNGPQRAPPNTFITQRRDYIVGLVFALQESAKRDGKKMTRDKASFIVSDSCRFSDHSYSVDTIKGWIKNRAAPGANAVASDLIKTAESKDDGRPLTDRVFDVGRNWFWLYCSVPSFDHLLKSRAERAFVARK
jgi:hypothetical protein